MQIQWELAYDKTHSEILFSYKNNIIEVICVV